ncbi:hypothetical protein BCR32DRAFT_306879 [Anaeromyces robustus]|uniref:Uncharacterized protein n=1 Tax=Anaeromyces robustus TaxID=1754192 RepID=A0A1Y1VSR2_9FUNG|nr:hypothetical protein BCR32DRAFT_306879 [Anaeromyces robustus]|eukprot:ORX64330.1 hypothetical protein BCR32DRAFT_306879 [Anaeromyces robustus]
MSNLNNELNICLNGDNFEVWHNIVMDTLYIKKLNKYAEKDIVKELKENAKDILKLESVFSIMTYLKGEYGEDETDMLYWANKIEKLKAKNIKEIPKILTKLDNIFENMNKSDFKLSDKEKIKYIYNTFPTGFKNKFEFKENEDSQSLIKRIKYNISMKCYAGQWMEKEEEEKDDPMEIDAIHKNFKKPRNFNNNSKNKNNNKSTINAHKKNNFGKNNDNKNNNKNNNKYCHICDKNGHSTKDCWFNLKNPNRKATARPNDNFNNEKQRYMGYMNNFELNDEYNNGFNNDELKYNIDNKVYNENDDNKSLHFINYNNHDNNYENINNKYKNTPSYKSNKRNEINIYGYCLKKYEFKNNKNNIMVMQNSPNVDELIWHRRLGHFYIKNLRNYLKTHNNEKEFLKLNNKANINNKNDNNNNKNNNNKQINNKKENLNNNNSLNSNNNKQISNEKENLSNNDSQNNNYKQINKENDENATNFSEESSHYSSAISSEGEDDGLINNIDPESSLKEDQNDINNNKNYNTNSKDIATQSSFKNLESEFSKK